MQQEEFLLSNRLHIRICICSLSKCTVWKDDFLQVSICLFLCICSMIHYFHTSVRHAIMELYLFLTETLTFLSTAWMYWKRKPIPYASNHRGKWRTGTILYFVSRVINNKFYNTLLFLLFTLHSRMMAKTIFPPMCSLSHTPPSEI